MSRVNPLVLASQANCQEDPDLDYDLPDTVQALLWACCSPDDYGAPEVSPLGETLRAGDDMAVSLLLQHGANPSRREDGCNDPIFLAYGRAPPRMYIDYYSTMLIRDLERPFRLLKGVEVGAEFCVAARLLKSRPPCLDAGR